MLSLVKESEMARKVTKQTEVFTVGQKVRMYIPGYSMHGQQVEIAEVLNEGRGYAVKFPDGQICAYSAQMIIKGE